MRPYNCADGRSHDGFQEEPNGYLKPVPGSDKYADQRRVFDDLGAGVLKNAFEGVFLEIHGFLGSLLI